MNAPNADLLLAQQWLARLAEQAGGQAMGPAELALPTRWIDAAAALTALALAEGKQVQIVVPDDETLPELSNALDIELRPLCLVLPEADFATRIALRATLTLLKSRLNRHADAHPVWDAQRRRIERLSGTWQSALAWGQSETEAQWPADIAHLFPARLMPASHAAEFAVPADLQLLIAPERMQSAHRDALVHLAPQVLCLSAASRGAEHRKLVVFNTEQRQRYELDVLSQEIAELELELATVQAEIADFSQRYHAAVGKLMVELDLLQAQIAALEAERKPDDAELKQAAEQSQAQAERSQQEQQRFEEAPNNEKAQAPEAQPFAPSRDLKKLYRQIAQKIHPDRASNEDDRNWRTHLMSEATRAYRNEDEAALRRVLTLWQEGPATGTDTTNTSSKNTLETQLKRMKTRLAGIQSELDRLLASRLYELFVAARLAQRQGRDLLQEMAVTVDLQIAAARQRLQELQDMARPEETA
jgi:hypothetical protein